MGHDYSAAGGYFVTICAHRRARLFGDIREGVMHLGVVGEIVQDEWFRTATVRPHVHLAEDEFVVMPDHIHGILWLADSETEGALEPRDPADRRAPAVVGHIIGQFKSIATKRINATLTTPGVRRWQRGYYDHVIRSETDLLRIRQYVRDNPLRWGVDRGQRVDGPVTRPGE